jgi:hypothetical protein
MPVCVMRVSGGEGNLTREGGTEQAARKNHGTSDKSQQHLRLDRSSRKKNLPTMDFKII